MLRPSKMLVSLQQLRYYCQSRISELFSVQKSSPIMRITQQTVVLFSDTIIQKAYFNPVSITKGPLKNDKFSLQIVQRQFPVSEVFSQPALHRRAWTSSLSGQYQFRTMMSSTSTSSNAPAATFLTWGVPRSTAGGFGRNPAFSRQFSTTKSPCVTLFQTNANNGQNNVCSHVSSRIFAPVGTKMNNLELDEKQSSKETTAFYDCNPNIDNSENFTCSNRLFSTHNNFDKGIGGLIYADESANEHNSKLIIRSQQQKRKHAINNRKLDAIIRHDDFYHENNNKRKVHSCINTRLKQPPDRPHVMKRHDPPMNTTSVYILIMLKDPIQFHKGESFGIESIEKMTIKYQRYINGVVKLLDKLKRHGQFRQVTVSQRQVRIYFPFTVKSEQQAMDVLYTSGIAYEKCLFTVVTEDRHSPDYFSFDSSDVTVGPDYFRNLQLILDHTDYLIERNHSFDHH